MIKKILLFLLAIFYCTQIVACGSEVQNKGRDMVEDTIELVEKQQTDLPKEEDIMSDMEYKTKIYSNASITMEYPGNWSIQDEAGEDGSRITFFDINNKEVFWFQQYEAWRANLDATEEEYKQILETEYGNVEILQMSKTIIENYDANTIVFSYLAGEQEYIMVRYVTVANYVGFEFNYMYDAESEDIYGATINKILESVNFTIE